MTDRLTQAGGAMRAYYDRRAAEYDTWWLGTGLFAGRDRPRWDEEREALLELLRGLPPRRTLDVACGTGFLSRALPAPPAGLTLLDQSPAMTEIAGGRVPHAAAVTGEAVPLPFPDDAFERVFTSHFYGHLLPDERTAFLAEARRVAPELIVVDSAGEPREEWQPRRLEDGTEHAVYKRWFTGASLRAEIGGEVLHDGRWFVAVQAMAL